MDLKYLSHKYQDELEVHMEAIKAKKEVWQKDMKELRAKREDKKELKEMGKDKKQMKEKAKRKKGQAKRGERGERGFMSKFLLWDTNAASEKNMRGFGMGR
jgi:hypothetical protein